MPRRKARPDPAFVPTGETALAIPVPPARRHHAHEVDPYVTPPGAINARGKLAESTTRPISRQLTAEDKAARAQARKDAKARGARYDKYLDALAENLGNQEAALAAVFPDLTPEAIAVQKYALLEAVRSGQGSSSIADVLEKHDLGLHARVSVLRQHVYSNNPAASLKAVDMVNELHGETSDQGTFESYLRIVKGDR